MAGSSIISSSRNSVTEHFRAQWQGAEAAQFHSPTHQATNHHCTHKRHQTLITHLHGAVRVAHGLVGAGQLVRQVVRVALCACGHGHAAVADEPHAAVTHVDHLAVGVAGARSSAVHGETAMERLA